MTRRLLPVLVLLVVQVALVLLFVRSSDDPSRQVWAQLAGFAVSLAMLAALRKVTLSRKVLTGVLLGGCAVLQIAALASGPSSSDDDYRYVWDAHVQLSGTDPYRYAPADPEVAHLRTDFTFPTERPCPAHQVGEICTEINRSSVHTIYPPVAQAAFVGMRLLGSGHDGHLPLQIAAAVGVLGSTLLLLRLRRGRTLWPVAVWALSPIVAVEATNNAHIDWLSVLMCLAAVGAARSRRPYAAGLAIGAAAATKLFPGLLLVMAGRRPWRMVLGAVTVLALGYLPHVLAVGPEVLGYLPGYLREEEYADGGRYLVVGLFVGSDIATILTPVLLAAGLVLLWWRADPDRPDLTAVAAVGLYLALTTPNYSWYPLLLVALVALTGRLRWLWLCVAPTLTYFAAALPWDWTVTRLVSYVGAVCFVLGCLLVRLPRCKQTWRAISS
ncbi:glycosyltransferase 87 family protein [Luteipulveratus mongoliensis]|uniref:glycosyltransferase 87 family protein n=1 Tax=Luteipulveratus mongoliensis TaxID=571913 RepID=UPI0014701C26|nr:glycosyltransferase 87 family protein [Luteipulveratus mongoliensis]